MSLLPPRPKRPPRPRPRHEPQAIPGVADRAEGTARDIHALLGLEEIRDDTQGLLPTDRPSETGHDFARRLPVQRGTAPELATGRQAAIYRQTTQTFGADAIRAANRRRG